MENYENLLKTLTDKLDKQARELQSIKSKLGNNSKSKNNNLNESVDKSRRSQQYGVKGQSNHFGDYCYKEYSYTERVYFPNKEIQLEDQRSGDYRNSSRKDGGYSTRSNYYPPKYVPDESLKQTRNDNQSKKNSLKHQQISESVLRARQNHLPFIIDKATHQRTCQACKKMIEKNCILIIHKEFVPYRSAKYGWDRPIFSREPVTQFYHFNKTCLELRGFENCYLAVCYVEVAAAVSFDDRAKIRHLGFKRKVREKGELVVPEEKTEVVVPGEKTKLVVHGEKTEFVLHGEKTEVVVLGEKAEVVVPGDKTRALVPVEKTEVLELELSVNVNRITIEDQGDGTTEFGSDEDDHGRIVEDLLMDATRDECDSTKMQCQTVEECDFDFCN